MNPSPTTLTRDRLLEYFDSGAKPRERFRVGMEIEKMGVDAATDRRIPYEGDGPSVRKVLEAIQARRGGKPILEAQHLVGLDAPWGSITLEPGGQVEWSSPPVETLDQLGMLLTAHLGTLRDVGTDCGVRWLDVAVDPERPVEEMPWMPKARYKIMRAYLGDRGRLAHRMMTQTAAIQSAFDYSDPADWRRKFRAAAVLAPVATALFANSRRIDGRESNYRSYRQAIWRETDPDRCGLPPVVFTPGFDMAAWLDWILDVPTLFRHRRRGLVAAAGVPFRELMQLTGCDAVRDEDWETHASTVFTEVRAYTYIEVRSADLQPDDLCLTVPTFWTGMLYDEDALDWADEFAAGIGHDRWLSAMDSASRDGLDGVYGDRPLNEIATEALAAAANGVRGRAVCVSDRPTAVATLERLADHVRLEINA